MESINNTLEDNFINETDKLEKVNILLDKLEGDKENINTNIIYNIATKRIEFKFDVLRKAITSSSNFEENIENFISYFQKTFTYSENHKLLAKLLSFIFEIEEEQGHVQHILKKLGIENINKVLLSNIFLEKSYNEADVVIKTYIRHLSIGDQAEFFNNAFKLAEVHHNVNVIYLLLENTDKAALTLDKSVLRTKNLCLYLTNSLVNSNERQDSKIIISILRLCINLVKKEQVELKFMNVDGDETAWTAFFALIQIFAYNRRKLMKPSLQLLSYVSSLHYFWQDCVYKLLIKCAPTGFTCEILASILKQKIDDENLIHFFRFIFPAINERKCDNVACPVLVELKNVCEKSTVENVSRALDEILSIFWDIYLVWRILENVLVDSKKKLVDFEYFSRILNHLDRHDFTLIHWTVVCREVKHLATFFFDPENFNFWKQIRSSRIPFPKDELPISEEFKTMAMPKLIELTKKNCDDLLEIEVYLGFLKDTITHTDIIKDYPVGIYVRLVIYKQLFNMDEYSTVRNKLDQEKTVNDFYDLLKLLNTKNYKYYINLMINFFSLMGVYKGFIYPEKLCAEFLKIIQNPELYTNYQILSANAIAGFSYNMYRHLWDPNKDIYKRCAQKWKYFVLETEDSEICHQGLGYVLEKDQLNTNEYNALVKNLLKKHLCDEVAEKIYSRYLNVDLINFAFQHLLDIKTYDLKKYEEFSELFCKAVVYGKYLASDQFCNDNEISKFCCLNSKHLECTIYEISSHWYRDYTECKEKILGLMIEIYLNKFSNLKTKVCCLHVLKMILSEFCHVNRPSTTLKNFVEDAQWIMNTFKKNYVSNLEDDRNRLRVIQGLFMLVPFVIVDLTLDEFKNFVNQTTVNIFKNLRNNLKIIAMGILEKESDGTNNAARHICQHMYILLFEQDVTFEEIKCIVEKAKEQPSLARSFIPVLYHVMPFCQLLKDELEELFASLFLLVLTSDDKTRIYTEILLQRVSVLYSNKGFEYIIERNASKLEQINLDIERNKNQIVDILKTDYIFLKDFDPVRDHSLETVLYILPKLNQVDSSEWKGIMEIFLIGCHGIGTYIKKKDDSETLKKSVEIFLAPQDNLNTYINYSAADILEMFR